MVDPVAGVANRRYLDRALADEVARARRMSYTLGLMLVEIGDLRVYAEACGHPAGDEALLLAADQVCRTVRATDIVSRYEEDVFAVILPGTPGSGARSVGEKVRRAMVRDLPPELTVFVGAAVSPGQRATARALLETADAALKGRHATAPAR